jgi:hypothetical protein
MTDKKKPTKPTGLDLLREPFPSHLIGKLPKPTKFQTEAMQGNGRLKNGIRCDICGQWHHPKVVHLDYVGHAALTDRLLDCDPKWNWEPIATDERGAPALDVNGGMWIKLTVCEVTRLGYGDGGGKRGGNAIKEAIGDALRNAAMRFGAALDLWCKEDLHQAVDDEVNETPPAKIESNAQASSIPVQTAIDNIEKLATVDGVNAYWKQLNAHNQAIARNQDVIDACKQRKSELELNDEIPY